jgi:hypothetical protein
MTPELEEEINDSPVYWFVVMHDALRRFEFERAAHAKKQLIRLGVRVSYARKPAKPRKGGPGNAS